MSSRVCKNCGALSDDASFCPDCGQSTKVQLLTIGELISESLATIYNLDSKLWLTLLPLLAKPGKLTNEYVAGKRARYMPPFRTYLVFSLLFFVFVSLDDLRIEADPGARADELVRELREEGVGGTPQGQQVIRSLVEQGVIPSEALEDLLAAAESPQTAVPATTGPPVGDTGPTISLDGPEDCAAYPWSDQLGPLGPRAQRACERILTDGWAPVIREFIDHIPILVFVSLPLVAGFMKLLYWVPARRYLVHLTFLFHIHAFFFAFLLLILLGGWLAARLPSLEWPITLLMIVGWLYVFVYLFVAMRRVYEQSRWLTAIKYVLLGPIYWACLATSFAAGLLFALVSI